MLEQDLASIMSFLTIHSGNPAPYYKNVPEQFCVPAVYFPRPEIGSSGDTLSTYALDFSLFVKFFHKTKEEAYELGFAAMNAILERRNRVPLIDETGKPTGKYIHIRDPTLRAVDESAVQLEIGWTARKPFLIEPVTMMQTYEIEGWHEPDIYITRRIETAYSAAVKLCTVSYPHPDFAGQEPKGSK